MKRSIALLCLVVAYVTNCSGATRLNDLPAYYDVRTGNVTIDLTAVEGGESIGYVFSYGLKLGDIRFENFTPFLNTFVTEANSKTVAETDFGGFPGGVYSLGDIFPAGLSEAELSELYFPKDARGEGGGMRFGPASYYAVGPLGGGVYHVFSPVYAPSPFPALNDPNVGVPTEIVWATAASLLYDPSSGALSIDTSAEHGGTIFSYELKFARNALHADAFEPITDDGFGVNVSPTNITEVGVAGIPAGRYSLGNLLSPGLTMEELTAAIPSASFVGQPGHGQDAIDIGVHGVPMSLGFLPDPPSVDFDDNGVVDVLDADALVHAIASRMRDLGFDLTLDGRVDQADLSLWLTAASTANGHAAPYLAGDANLDGAVNESDLNSLAVNWQRETGAWSAGDFNADRIVDAGDLNRLGVNWLRSAPLSIPVAATSVPEPSGNSLAGFLALVTMFAIRRADRNCR